MNWKDYEKEIHSYFSQMYPGACITYDAKIIGRYSNQERQIDVLIEDEVAGFSVKIIVDAKYFSRNIDVKCVESFISMMEDVNAHQGLLVTNKGFSKAAINRAYYGPSKLELDILNFDDLLKNQGLAAVPYAGQNGVLISAPFGWVIDNSRVHHALTCLYQRGRTLKQAQKELDWMYLNFWQKTDDVRSISELINSQNELMEHHYSNLKIENYPGPKREDNLSTRIRVAVADELPCIEITGFIDCGEFIAFFVVFAIEQFKNKNQRKLHHVLKYAQPVMISFDNRIVIEQLKTQCKSIKNPEEKSDAYRQIADWYAEMGEKTNALNYYRLSFSEYSSNYINLKKLIMMELSYGDPEKAKECAIILFRMDPTNPTVMQNLVELYHRDQGTEYFSKVIKFLATEYGGNQEALGNINTHYGMYLHEKGETHKAIEYLKSAKQNFEIAFNNNHYVIRQIEDYLEKIA